MFHSLILPHLLGRIAYVETVAQAVRTSFGADIKGDLSLLHGESYARFFAVD